MNESRKPHLHPYEQICSAMSIGLGIELETDYELDVADCERAMRLTAEERPYLQQSIFELDGCLILEDSGFNTPLKATLDCDESAPPKTKLLVSAELVPAPQVLDDDIKADEHLKQLIARPKATKSTISFLSYTFRPVEKLLYSTSSSNTLA